MTKPFIALALLAALLPLACSGEDEPPNPLASRGGFCQAWAEAACQTDVVEYCNAASADDCIATQEDFCRGIVPSTYASDRAEQCISAVKAAYADAELTAEEIQVVRYLAAPCDQLSKGSAAEGEACASNDECDSAGGFSCIVKPGDAEGTCQKPEVVGPGRSCSRAAQVCDEENFCNGSNCIAFRETGDDCEGDHECAPSDRCVIDGGATEGVCTARLARNADCANSADCASGYCAGAGAAGKCATLIRLAINEPLCEDLR